MLGPVTPLTAPTGEDMPSGADVIVQLEGTRKEEVLTLHGFYNSDPTYH